MSRQSQEGKKGKKMLVLSQPNPPDQVDNSEQAFTFEYKGDIVIGQSGLGSSFAGPQ